MSVKEKIWNLRAKNQTAKKKHIKFGKSHATIKSSWESFIFPAVNIYKHNARNLKTIFILIICYYRIHLAIIPLNMKKKCSWIKSCQCSQHKYCKITLALFFFFISAKFSLSSLLSLSSSTNKQHTTRWEEHSKRVKDKASACTETKRNLVNLYTIHMHTALHIPYCCVYVLVWWRFFFLFLFHSLSEAGSALYFAPLITPYGKMK